MKAQSPTTAADGVVFRLLRSEPLLITFEDKVVHMPSGRQSRVLSTLLLHANTSVSVDHLIDIVWDHDPPDTARTQIQICVSRLRRLLDALPADLVTRSNAYRLNVDADLLDATRFEAIVDRADALVQEGREAEASILYRQATGLWQGTLPANDSSTLGTRFRRLEEERLRCTEAYIDLELRLGRHARLVAELIDLCTTHPHRQRLRIQLMHALYESGRSAEALEEYRALRTMMIEDLGLEPSTEASALEQVILRGDPVPMTPLPTTGATGRPASDVAAHPGDGGLDEHREDDTSSEELDDHRPGRAGTGQPALFQLPRASDEFVGREPQLAAAMQRLRDPARGVVALTGRPGVGKTMTAIQAAHQVASYFPDGHLYCNLRATSSSAPPSSQDVLSRFLRSLGVPGDQIPRDEDERSSLFRALLADKRILLLLDDAVDEAQVTPLLPGWGCGVIVTSRFRFTALSGAHVIELDTFDPAVSLALLSKVIGSERVLAEEGAALGIAEAVGHLPLAIRLIGARLAGRPRVALAALERRLTHGHPLPLLQHNSLGIRELFGVVMDSLDPNNARLLEIIGSLDVPVVPGWQVGALLDQQVSFPAELADGLVDLHLLDVEAPDATGEPNFSLHALVRAYLAERVPTVTSSDRHHAARRYLGAWLAAVEQMQSAIVRRSQPIRIVGQAQRWHPPPETMHTLLADPVLWFETEASNIASAIRMAVRDGLLEHAWELLARISNFRTTPEHVAMLKDLVPYVRASLPDDSVGAATMDTITAGTLAADLELGQRRELLERSLLIFDRHEERTGKGLALRWLADLARREGDLEAAMQHVERAEEVFDSLDQPGGTLWCLLLKGPLLAELGRLKEAELILARAMVLAREASNERTVAQTMTAQGGVAVLAGRWDAAEGYFREALEWTRSQRDKLGEEAVLRKMTRAFADRPLADHEELVAAVNTLRGARSARV